MAKRRRERDRPKHNSTAAYNPYERTLLNYGSDDEISNATGGFDDRQSKRQKGEEEETVNAQAQGQAWQDDDGVEDSSASESEQYPSRKPRKKNVWLAIDEDTGMRPMFRPAKYLKEHVENDADFEDYDSTTEEALAYLTSVQSERQILPSIMTAQKPKQLDIESLEFAPGIDMAEGSKFIDGICCTLSVEKPKPLTRDDYTKSLIGKFRNIRKIVHRPVDPEEWSTSIQTVFISHVPRNNKDMALCTRLVLNTYPTIAQFKELSTETAWDLLVLVVMRYLLLRGQEIPVSLGWWTYYLLACIEEPTRMTAERFSDLRELAIQMVSVRASLDAMRAADAHWAASATSVTVDTTLVIVGDFFRQRDLLDHRNMKAYEALGEADAQAVNKDGE